MGSPSSRRGTPLLSFRFATNLDSTRVSQLVFQVLLEYGLQPDPHGTDLDLNDLEGNYFRQGGCFLVMESDQKEITGCGGIFPLAEGVCELRKMYLKKAMRGQGLGKALLSELLQKAKDAGFRRVELETASVLKEAAGLYHSFGFQPFGKQHLAPRCTRALFLNLEAWKPG